MHENKLISIYMLSFKIFQMTGKLADMPVARTFHLPVDLFFVVEYCVFFIFPLFLFNIHCLLILFEVQKIQRDLTGRIDFMPRKHQ